MSQMIMPALARAKTERANFMASEDIVLIKQIMATHTSDSQEIDVKPIFQIVEDILTTATITTASSSLPSETEVPNAKALATLLEALSYIINRLSCEISYKCMGGGDGHSTTVSLLNLLSSYSWEAKLVLTLAAFAINYGDFWLLAQIYTTNKLASRMAILKQLPALLDQADAAPLKPRFDALNDLIRSILNLARCMVHLSDLPKEYTSNSKDISEYYSTAVNSFPLATYWILRSLVACATNIANIQSSMGHELTISTIEVPELYSLTRKVKHMNEHFQKQLDAWQKYSEEKVHNEKYQALLSKLEADNNDNVEVLKLLIHPKLNHQLPLLDCAKNKRVNIDVLKRKTVLLLISGFDISTDPLTLLILENVFQEAKGRGDESSYEVIWLPVVDSSIQWTDSYQRQFENLQSSMPWYSLYHPSLIDDAAIRFFKRNLNFNRKPIVAVLNPHGKLVCPNALPMIFIWQNLAFPFTASKEEAIWEHETWRLDLLVDGIDPMISEWMMDKRHIILYGSDDIDWIRRFTVTTRGIASTLKLPLEIFYIGSNSSKRQKTIRALEVIDNENLSHKINDMTILMFFWTRLESMFFSKIKHQRSHDNEKDFIFQGVKKLLSYNKTGPWVLLSKGSEIILISYGETVLSAFIEYETWKKDVEVKGFGNAFRDQLEKFRDLSSHSCCRLELKENEGRILESIKCPECERNMEKFVSFSCCHE